MAVRVIVEVGSLIRAEVHWHGVNVGIVEEVGRVEEQLRHIPENKTQLIEQYANSYNHFNFQKYKNRLLIFVY